MSDDETDIIELAIKSLEKAISQILKRCDHKPNDKSHRRIRRLVEHARHIFIELFNKRRSLKAFLLWFRQEWIRIQVDLDIYPVQILQHSMQHFLRCQDAFILLTSGECRHEHDTKLAKTTKFRSRLSTLQERDDGYTVLYKDTGIYSGYGFDEFNNEVVGIRALLVKELKRYHKSPWDYLERQGGTELLESLLDQHEREAKELQHSLQSLKRRMIEDMNKRLTPTNLKFATQDKMERLCLSAQGRRINLERRAGSFRIEGPLLPDKNKKPKDWNCCSFNFKNEKKDPFPTWEKQKRRRIIVNSDGEDEIIDICDKNDTKSNNNPEQTAGKSSGLVVRIDSSCSNSEKEDSLAVIKNQLGVNTHDLEQAREILEGEDTKTNWIFEQEKVVRLEKILNRVLTRDEIDENEVWDARECLRYACMEAGNKYLWDSRVGCVGRALDNFEKAKQIVEMQQKSQQQQQQAADGESALLVQLNLMYLHGQAVVNIGISLVDNCHRKISTSKDKVLRAIKEFETAQLLMAKLHGLAGKARKSSSSTIESTSYVFKSKQLESLACRWMGRGFWLISQEKKSIAAFEQASQTFNDANLQEWQNSGYYGDIFEVAAEAIYATCDLADRCYSRMEEFEYQSALLRKKGNGMLDTVTRALNRHIEISESIERYYCPFRAKHFRVEFDISSIEDVRLYRDEIVKRWKDLVNKQVSCAPPTKGHRRLTVKRSDVTSSTNIVLTSDEPRSNSIFSSDGSKRRRYQTHSKESYYTNGYRGNKERVPSTNTDAVYALSSEVSHHQPRPPIQFRKWGDEILIAEQHEAQQENSCGEIGEYRSSSLVLAFPSIAPPKPIEDQLNSNPR
jgi:tellurite resistance protein